MTEQDMTRADFVELFIKTRSHIWYDDQGLWGFNGTTHKAKVDFIKLIFKEAQILFDEYVKGLEQAKKHIARMFRYIHNGNYVNDFEWRSLGEWAGTFEELNECEIDCDEAPLHSGCYVFRLLFRLRDIVAEHGIVDDEDETLDDDEDESITDYFDESMRNFMEGVEYDFDMICSDMHSLFWNLENHYVCPEIYHETKKAIQSIYWEDDDQPNTEEKSSAEESPTPHAAPHEDEDTPNDGTSTAAKHNIDKMDKFRFKQMLFELEAIIKNSQPHFFGATEYFFEEFNRILDENIEAYEKCVGYVVNNNGNVDSKDWEKMEGVDLGISLFIREMIKRQANEPYWNNHALHESVGKYVDLTKLLRQTFPDYAESVVAKYEFVVGCDDDQQDTKEESSAEESPATQAAPHENEDTPDDDTSTAAMEDEETSSTSTQTPNLDKLDGTIYDSDKARHYFLRAFEEGMIEEVEGDWIWKWEIGDLKVFTDKLNIKIGIHSDDPDERKNWNPMQQLFNQKMKLSSYKHKDIESLTKSRQATFRQIFKD